MLNKARAWRPDKRNAIVRTRPITRGLCLVGVASAIFCCGESRQAGGQLSVTHSPMQADTLPAQDTLLEPPIAPESDFKSHFADGSWTLRVDFERISEFLAEYMPSTVMDSGDVALFLDWEWAFSTYELADGAIGGSLTATEPDGRSRQLNFSELKVEGPHFYGWASVDDMIVSLQGALEDQVVRGVILATTEWVPQELLTDEKLVALGDAPGGQVYFVTSQPRTRETDRVAWQLTRGPATAALSSDAPVGWAATWGSSSPIWERVPIIGQWGISVDLESLRRRPQPPELTQLQSWRGQIRVNEVRLHRESPSLITSVSRPGGLETDFGPGLTQGGDDWVVSLDPWDGIAIAAQVVDEDLRGIFLTGLSEDEIFYLFEYLRDYPDSGLLEATRRLQLPPSKAIPFVGTRMRQPIHTDNLLQADCQFELNGEVYWFGGLLLECLSLRAEPRKLLPRPTRGEFETSGEFEQRVQAYDSLLRSAPRMVLLTLRPTLGQYSFEDEGFPIRLEVYNGGTRPKSLHEASGGLFIESDRWSITAEDLDVRTVHRGASGLVVSLAKQFNLTLRIANRDEARRVRQAETDLQVRIKCEYEGTRRRSFIRYGYTHHGARVIRLKVIEVTVQVGDKRYAVDIRSD